MSITTTEELQLAMTGLNAKRISQEQEFKTKLQDAKDWIKPKNILKRGVSNMMHSDSKGEMLLKAGAGVGVVALTGKLLAKNFKKIGGFFLKKTVRRFLPF
ncbi:hypothetical protein [Ferruginibacter sp. HRS2-29]|uniref:hypothetical protein n=1 Tax=Ferruginibacter sp. HRS2-29 TaxID=2487334 RepID=UPI0020CBACBF|nr:hypothetical protein [Ferruginibacter sp. HRS2-29]MCP9749679.1 hypothetical protein [Ferruginibacter sp. HRS2-29]